MLDILYMFYIHILHNSSPRQMTQLINYIYDWLIEMKPQGVEEDIYDQLGWIELLNQWTVNWLSKLYTKRKKSEGTNRYDECITLLINRYTKLWDQYMTCKWRNEFPQRILALEKVASDIYEAR